MPTQPLTAHFTLDEMIASQTAARMGISNMPNDAELVEVKATAEVLEKIRDRLGGKPMLISSGFPNSGVNQAVGGATNSAHLTGRAADFTCPGFGDPLEICKILEPHMGVLGIDHLIHEYGSWVHVGRSPGTPRQMALTIDNAETRTGFG